MRVDEVPLVFCDENIGADNPGQGGCANRPFGTPWEANPTDRNNDYLMQAALRK